MIYESWLSIVGKRLHCFNSEKRMLKLHVFMLQQQLLIKVMQQKVVLVMSEVQRLVVTVKEIRGKCPVYKVGDKIVVEAPKIVTAQTDALCVHALGSVLSIIIPLARGVSFKDLGLAHKEKNVGYVQCLDPGQPYTPGGTVIFEIRREPVR